MISFTLNGSAISVDVEPDTPVLWVLRDHLKIMGTKFGCGAGLCGACTLHVDGKATRSCLLPVSSVNGKSITTIEGLGGDHALQRAWEDNRVPQCGYCQSGQIMQAASLLAENPTPNDDEIKAAMAGNICRCGTYPRILSAIKQVVSSGLGTKVSNSTNGFNKPINSELYYSVSTAGIHSDKPVAERS